MYRVELCPASAPNAHPRTGYWQVVRASIGRVLFLFLENVHHTAHGVNKLLVYLAVNLFPKIIDVDVYDVGKAVEGVKMLSLMRPLPSMLILTFQVLRTDVNASLVNWQPWSPSTREVSFTRSAILIIPSTVSRTTAAPSEAVALLLLEDSAARAQLSAISSLVADISSLAVAMDGALPACITKIFCDPVYL